MATLDKPIVSFAKLTSGMEHPNLLDVQLRAFDTLLQTDAAARERHYERILTPEPIECLGELATSISTIGEQGQSISHRGEPMDRGPA